MATYQLARATAGSARPGNTVRRGLASAEVVSSARWYTQVRWIAAAVFAVVGVLFLPAIGFGEHFGIRSLTRPMWTLAAFLGLANLPFRYAVRRGDLDPRRAKLLLWGEILVDLFSVTYLVHVVGSVDTFVAFFYLLHITLSCIALSPSESLAVAVIASVLYLATVALETLGIWPYRAIMSLQIAPAREHPSLAVLFAASAVFLWFVIWYFISTLSQSLRTRELQLREANERLLAIDEEKNRIMIHTTHDLKSPFFGIEMNIQLLEEKLGERLPEEAQRPLERIRSQSKTLRSRIDSILLYNELRSRTRHGDEQLKTVDLAELVADAVEELRPWADQRGVSILQTAPSFRIDCRRKQLSVLLANVLANAVAYSREGGKIEIVAGATDAGARLAISDEGIGIRAEALPHIFDEYFRTREAVNVNRSSTGLGLAIVKEIAQRNAMGIRVTSIEGKGTTFEVTIPKEMHDGKDPDY